MSAFSQLESYDDEWVNLFRKEAQVLMELLPEEYLLEFHHIGSTAIPEMPAKPIIDIGVMISSFEEGKDKIVPLMIKSGYVYKWREDRKPGFMTFIKHSGDTGYEIHMAIEEHGFWDCLYFREFLKKHSSEARNYFDLKNELIKQFGEDHDAYNSGKVDYINRITIQAKQELDEI